MKGLAHWLCIGYNEGSGRAGLARSGAFAPTEVGETARFRHGLHRGKPPLLFAREAVDGQQHPTTRNALARDGTFRPGRFASTGSDTVPAHAGQPRLAATQREAYPIRVVSIKSGLCRACNPVRGNPSGGRLTRASVVERASYGRGPQPSLAKLATQTGVIRPRSVSVSNTTANGRVVNERKAPSLDRSNSAVYHATGGISRGASRRAITTLNT